MRKRSLSVGMPRRSHSARMRSASSADGVTASWSAPRAASIIVLEPAPVSSVAMPGSTFCSSQRSAGHARPQYCDPSPCSAGGSEKSEPVSDDVTRARP